MNEPFFWPASAGLASSVSALPPATCRVWRPSIRKTDRARFVPVGFWGPGPKNGIQQASSDLEGT
jgi:hypothetical protein